MKTNVFDFNRIGLLFQRYFIERSRSELIYWGIMAIVFMFLRNQLPAMFALILIAGVFYAVRFFMEIHHSGNGIAYFMIPATQLEKLTVSIVMTSLYYFIMMIIVYIIGNLAGTFLYNMIASIDFFPNALFHHSPLQWKLFEFESGHSLKLKGMDIQNMVALFISFLLSQSLFLLGGIYFKKNQVSKTFLSIILFQILVGIVALVEVYLIFGGSTTSININWNLDISDKIVQILYVLPVLFFWVVSYFRLTEKQV